ncbi:MAG: hypothetical protein QOJ71_559, partial [Actinomycetota bacterium]|nr:hypothetical protein [Actinomycetota bacterium]
PGGGGVGDGDVAAGDDDALPLAPGSVVGDEPPPGTVVVRGAGFAGSGGDFFPAVLARGFAEGVRGGAPAAVAVPAKVALPGVVDAPDAGAVAPIEAMIDKKAEMLRPATRIRVPVAGCRRRRDDAPGLWATGVPVPGLLPRARRCARRASRASRSGVGSVTRPFRSGPSCFPHCMRRCSFDHRHDGGSIWSGHPNCARTAERRTAERGRVSRRGGRR